MRNKLLSYKKTKLLLNLKKYSNVIIFTRKEEELLKRNNSSVKSKKNLLNKTFYNQNKTFNEKPNIKNEISAYALKTISSFKNSFDSFSTQTTLNKKQNTYSIQPYFQTISNFYPNNKINKTSIKKNKNVFYLTQNITYRDILFNKNNKNKNKFNSEFNSERFNTINYINPREKNIFCIKEKKYDINLLNNIKAMHYKENEKKTEKNLLNMRLKKLASEKYNVPEDL